MSKQFIPPIIEQWIEKIDDPKVSMYNKGTYSLYLERTRDAINQALLRYENIKNKK